MASGFISSHWVAWNRNHSSRRLHSTPRAPFPQFEQKKKDHEKSSFISGNEINFKSTPLITLERIRGSSSKKKSLQGVFQLNLACLIYRYRVGVGKGMLGRLVTMGKCIFPYPASWKIKRPGTGWLWKFDAFPDRYLGAFDLFRFRCGNSMEDDTVILGGGGSNELKIGVFSKKKVEK